ncbi:MAG: methyltransferase domain-containing protein [Acidimicrobiia bacterium]|nr:methyltransferase domain-containing protein [Acidimicrobiia bacterium]
MPDTSGATRRAQDLANRVFDAALGTFDVFAIYVGDRLSYYQILGEHGPMTTSELAEMAGTEERYTREWLEQQAVSGFVYVAEMSDDGRSRRFALPPEYASVLTDELSLSYLAPLARMIATAGMKLSAVVEAHRNGGGVSWDEFGADMRESQADMNRPSFMKLLAQEWFGSVPDLADRLTSGARVADIGCGFGWSSISLAVGYDRVTVDGYDLDEPSIDYARIHAVEAGVDDRVTFHALDAGDPSVQGDYDVVAAFECIHDMPDPVATLTSMRRIAADDGYVVVMDEKVSEAFHPDAGEIEQLMYGFSNFICLPDGMAHLHSAGTGTVMRPDTLRRYASEAGFSDVEVMPIETEMWRFYRLV